MVEFIVNPRRAARAPARCRAAVVTVARAFEAETEDIGALGCQVVAPSLVKKGDRMELAISSPKTARPLEVAGNVAWVSRQPPWRVGIAFADAFVPAAERWFEELVASTPGLGPIRRVPERIPLDAMVYLGPPPRFVVDFTGEEAALLRAIASGVRLDELKARLRDRWAPAQLALFSLLARQCVTFVRGQAAHPEAWKRILTQVEASLAVESLGTAPLPTPPPAARARPLPTPPPAAARPHEAAAPTPTPAPVAADRGATGKPQPPLDLERAPWEEDTSPAPVPPRGAGRAEPVRWGAPRPAEGGGAGDGWKRPAHERGPEAQVLYDRALAALEGGDVTGAIALLRRALTEAPGDPEIAAALGKLAFRGLSPGTG